MKTSVVMRRSVEGLTELDVEGAKVLQRTEDGYFLLSSVAAAANRWRALRSMPTVSVYELLQRQGTVEFLEALKDKIEDDPIKRVGRGRASKTWVHPYVMLEIMMSLAPEFRVEVYGWMYDRLIEYRNTSGDSYKKLTGAVYQRCANKWEFPRQIALVANRIKEACGVDDWQVASEQQLKNRDAIHEKMALLCDVVSSVDEALRISIVKTIPQW